jgi:hypothetical protein
MSTPTWITAFEDAMPRETTLDFLDAPRELRQPRCKLRKPLLLSRLENISLLPGLDRVRSSGFSRPEVRV